MVSKSDIKPSSTLSLPRKVPQCVYSSRYDFYFWVNKCRVLFFDTHKRCRRESNYLCMPLIMTCSKALRAGLLDLTLMEKINIIFNPLTRALRKTQQALRSASPQRARRELLLIHLIPILAGRRERRIRGRQLGQSRLFLIINLPSRTSLCLISFYKINLIFLVIFVQVVLGGGGMAGRIIISRRVTRQGFASRGSVPVLDGCSPLDGMCRHGGQWCSPTCHTGHGADL